MESKGVNPIEFSPVREDGAFVIGESLEDIPDPVLEEITQSISGQLLEAEIYQ